MGFLAVPDPELVAARRCHANGCRRATRQDEHLCSHHYGLVSSVMRKLLGKYIRQGHDRSGNYLPGYVHALRLALDSYHLRKPAEQA